MHNLILGRKYADAVWGVTSLTKGDGQQNIAKSERLVMLDVPFRDYVNV